MQGALADFRKLLPGDKSKPGSFFLAFTRPRFGIPVNGKRERGDRGNVRVITQNPDEQHFVAQDDAPFLLTMYLQRALPCRLLPGVCPKAEYQSHGWQ